MGIVAVTEDKLSYGYVGPDTIGQIVAATGTLALVLSVAMSGAGAVPFAVAMFVIVVVIMAHTGFTAFVVRVIFLHQSHALNQCQ